MSKTSIADIKARLSEYLERVEGGERIVICRHNKPVAELVPVEYVRTEPRPLGPLAGRPPFTVPEAFLEPLSTAELDAWEGGVFPGLPAAGTLPASRVAEHTEHFGTDASPGRRK